MWFDPAPDAPEHVKLHRRWCPRGSAFAKNAKLLPHGFRIRKNAKKLLRQGFRARDKCIEDEPRGSVYAEMSRGAALVAPHTQETGASGAQHTQKRLERAA